MTNLPPHLQAVCDEYKDYLMSDTWDEDAFSEPYIKKIISTQRQCVEKGFQACYEAMVGDIERNAMELSKKPPTHLTIRSDIDVETVNEIFQAGLAARDAEYKELVEALEKGLKEYYPTDGMVDIETAFNKFKGTNE